MEVFSKRLLNVKGSSWSLQILAVLTILTSMAKGETEIGSGNSTMEISVLRSHFRQYSVTLPLNATLKDLKMEMWRAKNRTAAFRPSKQRYIVISYGKLDKNSQTLFQFKDKIFFLTIICDKLRVPLAPGKKCDKSNYLDYMDIKILGQNGWTASSRLPVEASLDDLKQDIYKQYGEGFSPSIQHYSLDHKYSYSLRDNEKLSKYKTETFHLYLSNRTYKAKSWQMVKFIGKGVPQTFLKVPITAIMYDLKVAVQTLHYDTEPEQYFPNRQNYYHCGELLKNDSEPIVKRNNDVFVLDLQDPEDSTEMMMILMQKSCGHALFPILPVTATLFDLKQKLYELYGEEYHSSKILICIFIVERVCPDDGESIYKYRNDLFELIFRKTDQRNRVNAESSTSSTTAI